MEIPTNDLKQKVVEKAHQIGMDLIEFTNLERLKNAPKRFHAGDYLPSAKSVIVIGCKMPDGSVENWSAFFCFKW